jgi:hypothetical protein
MTVEPELQTRLLALGRAIDDALIASHGPRSALKAGHPSFDAPLVEGLRRYGPGPVFDLWVRLAALNELSRQWTGKPFPVAGAPTIEAADEAPGLTTELARSNGHDETAQPISAD